jgi:hypothetical protein
MPYLDGGADVVDDGDLVDDVDLDAKDYHATVIMFPLQRHNDMQSLVL